MATYLAVLAVALAVVALVAAYLAMRQLARLRRASALLARRTRGGDSLAELIEHTRDDTTELVAQVRELRAALPEDVGDDRGSLGHVGLVRYDAFADVSGHLSFSLALLNERGDGVTISAIAGRAETRVYAKPVAGGAGQQELSPEEVEAVRAAAGSRRWGRRAAKGPVAEAS